MTVILNCLESNNVFINTNNKIYLVFLLLNYEDKVSKIVPIQNCCNSIFWRKLMKFETFTWWSYTNSAIWVLASHLVSDWTNSPLSYKRHIHLVYISCIFYQIFKLSIAELSIERNTQLLGFNHLLMQVANELYFYLVK